MDTLTHDCIIFAFKGVPKKEDKFSEKKKNKKIHKAFPVETRSRYIIIYSASHTLELATLMVLIEKKLVRNAMQYSYS